MEPKIVFNNVSKQFNMYKKQSEKLLEILSIRKQKENFFALKNVSFSIHDGEAIGIVGLNGSGKSTLSNLLAKIVPASSGNIKINGVPSLIAISVGLNNHLTGLENIELKCLMHGLNKSEIINLKKEIIEFADLGKFIDQPVKKYSSGMKARLGFVISVHTNPDILIIDEALSVGDQTFYQKCLNKINDFKSRGKTIVFISHSLSQVEALCDRTMWMHFGKLQMFDETKKVLSEYNKFIREFNSLSECEKKSYRNEMLTAQYNMEEFSSDQIRSRKSHNENVKKAKKNPAFGIQVLVLIIAVLFSASYMFGAKPVESISEQFSNKQDTIVIKEQAKTIHGKSKEIIPEMIGKPGVVVSGNAAFFDSVYLISQNGELNVFEEVIIEEQLNDVYLFNRADNTTGYIETNKIKLKEDSSGTRENNLKMEEFLPLFQEEFANSYEYFFSFINSDLNDVKSKLNGATREETLETGNKLLEFSNYHFSYNAAQGKIINTISIDIDTSLDQWANLKEKAEMVSDDSQHYFFLTDQYEVVIDLENNTANFTTL